MLDVIAIARYLDPARDERQEGDDHSDYSGDLASTEYTANAYPPVRFVRAYLRWCCAGHDGPPQVKDVG
jgi:hypothetical protein